ncbi:MAG: cbb3-type cytochrome c oxidase subunit I [Burkholderiaceae bacterium]
MNTVIDTLHGGRRPARTATAPDVRYIIAVPLDSRRTLARGWMWLGLLALIGSGVFSLLLVLARTPVINAWLPGTDFFRVALVIHVDLSVLVWFVALAGMLWSLNSAPRSTVWNGVALAACGLGACLMAASAFFGTGVPIMANYIPVLDRPLFLFALLLFGLGAAVLAVHSLWAAPKPGPVIDGQGALQFGLNAAAISAAVAVGAFVWSYLAVPTTLEGKAYYEILFWGAGHALQFTWTLLMLVAWLALASASGARLAISPRITVLMFALALVAVFVTPYAYLAHDIASVEHRALLTWAMRVGGGLAIAPIALAVVVGLVAAPPADAGARPLRAALVWSMLLFVAGGAIGIFISGANVRIPAHYHGCIVGVTLALMGLAYHLLPRLGYSRVDSRLAAIQPAVYGFGQLMHITGLVWSGGYGVQRKVAGADQVLRSAGEIASMGLMGLGGLVAIVGGLLFVVVALRALGSRSTPIASGSSP